MIEFTTAKKKKKKKKADGDRSCCGAAEPELQHVALHFYTYINVDTSLSILFFILEKSSLLSTHSVGQWWFNSSTVVQYFTSFSK